VRAEALALAGHAGGDEVERVELRVGVGERGAGLAPLVDDEVEVGRAVVRAHALAPGLDRDGHLAGPQLGQRHDRVRGVDDHLVPAAGGLRGEQVGLGVARRRLGVLEQRRIEVRHDAHAPARRVGTARAGADRVHLGRRLVLVALGEGIAGGIDRWTRGDGEDVARAVGAPGGDDRLEPGERVDPDLVRHRSAPARYWSMSSARSALER
jgi:hypothetical protein